uniref:Uncharacterized protein n=1 Tax=Klebsiella pneumoniae TaxID=573 RepID=A0A8B0SWA1_KLEPN|nr:hypothetical protein [Klebsiella pneumoniae]
MRKSAAASFPPVQDSAVVNVKSLSMSVFASRFCQFIDCFFASLYSVFITASLILFRNDRNMSVAFQNGILDFYLIR